MACCVKTACCSALCCLCSKCGVPRRLFARIGYVIFMLSWVVFSIIMLFYGDHVFSVFNRFMHCPSNELKESCIQISAVFRVSFVLVIFHFLLFIICLFKGQLPSAINEGAWPLKILISIGLYVISFFITNSFFKIYGYVAMGCSGLFMIYEMVLLIDLAYTWNSHWVSSYENASAKGSTGICWLVLLFVFTAVFYGAGITVCVLMYKYYSHHWWTILLTSCTIVFGIVYSSLSLSSKLATGSIFTCSIIFAFVSCLNASALMSDPTEEPGRNALLQIFIGLGFLFVILFYVSGVTSDSRKKIQESTQSTEKDTKIIARPGAAVMEKNEHTGMPIKSYRAIENEEEEEELPKNTLATALFHLLMVFASFNLAMILTNWGAPNLADDNENYTGFSKEWLGFWMKLAAQWIATLLFIWSLIAPKLFPSREFA